MESRHNDQTARRLNAQQGLNGQRRSYPCPCSLCHSSLYPLAHPRQLSAPLRGRERTTRERGRVGALFFGGTLALATSLWAEGSATTAAAPGAAGPRITFAEPVYDFGTVVVGDVVKHVFTFTNTGGQTLEIEEVKSSCGCTSAGAWSRRTEPGKSGTIPVEFQTGHFSGLVIKPVTVICNDTNPMAVTLQLKGIVWHPIDVLPSAATFSGVLETPTNMYRTLRITNQEERPLILGQPESNQRAIAAEITTNEPGRAYELTVRLVPPLGAGNVFGEVSIKTSSSKMPVISVPVWAIPQPAVMVLPPRLELPGGRFTNKVTRSVSVRNNGATPLVLSDPALSVQGVEAQLYELQKGQYFTVMLTFPEGFEAAKDNPIELSFKSNNPKFPVLRVPIVQK